jgi:putative oxidoreductase
MFPLLYIFSDVSVLFLRLVLGLIFVAHGWPKIKSLKTTAQNFSAMGFKPGVFWGPLTAILEFFGGIVLILGLYVQIAAFLFAVEFLVVNAWKILKRQGFVGGFDFDLLIFVAVLVLLTFGGGAISADKFLFLGGF